MFKHPINSDHRGFSLSENVTSLVEQAVSLLSRQFARAVETAIISAVSDRNDGRCTLELVQGHIRQRSVRHGDFQTHEIIYDDKVVYTVSLDRGTDAEGHTTRYSIQLTKMP